MPGNVYEFRDLADSLISGWPYHFSISGINNKTRTEYCPDTGNLERRPLQFRLVASPDADQRRLPRFPLQCILVVDTRIANIIPS